MDVLQSLLRRFAVLLVAAAFACAAAPAAGDRSTSIARGVRVGDVVLTGLSSTAARIELREGFARPLELAVEGRSWRVPSSRFASAPEIDDTVREALGAAPGTNLALGMSIDEDGIREYVAGLAPRFYRAPREPRLADLDERLVPVYAPGAPGRRLERAALARRIADALVAGERRPIRLPFVRVKPKTTVRDIGSVIVIRRESKTLTLFDGRRVVRVFRVATGTASYPTPLGRFDIVVKQYHPWWYPPPSDWAKGLKPVPPGPGNPLGTRWMGLSAWSVGIHGTPDAASIGYSASHGCIRMHVPDAEWLFERVRLGTVVFIVSA
jgi:lipoprotein-anchoring transpeptidase ErfK/SrfK